MGKKNSSGGWLVGGLIAVVIFGQALKDIWPWLLIGGLAYAVYRYYKASPKSESTPAPPATKQNEGRAVRHDKADETDFTVPASIAPSSGSGHRISPPPKESVRDARWIPGDEIVEIAGLRISGGMLYVGHNLPGGNRYPDPALIDPRRNVAKQGDFTERHTDYWPSYSAISAQARRAYLNWLADGRKHPEADVGYVFLYFYGLERRALIDIFRNGGDKSELPHIAAELRRLLGIYGPRSHSFRSYCSRFLDFLALIDYPPKLYTQPVPVLTSSGELPFYLRLAIGQATVDRTPIPTPIAFAWSELDPTIIRRTAVTRCRDEFRKLFAIKYRELFSDGITLSPNKTKLKVGYHPASSGFHGAGEIVLKFGEIPDITALTAPGKQLQSVVDACAEALAAYSRFVGKNSGKGNSLEALLQLPAQIWPSSARSALRRLRERVGNNEVVMTLGSLASEFGSSGDLTKERTLAFARALESEKIGVEPDVLGGSRMPKPEDSLVLFQLPAGTTEPRSTAPYQAAVVTLELAAAVAHADGEFSEAEAQHLCANIESWVHLAPCHRSRLKARVRLLMESPVTLTGMKRKVEDLEASAREAIASFTALMVQSDGKTTADEVKLLEKVYALLGVEKTKLYSDIHAAATSSGRIPTPASASVVPKPTGAGTTSFTLDPARIAALQKDSEKVSALLGNIFNEEAEAVQVLVEAEEPEDSTEQPVAQSILGLDEVHSAFVRILLSRPSWDRAELEDVASDLQIMLDGAMERINESAFDTFDIPLSEGDDPIEINPEFLEKLNDENIPSTTERP